jgi:hypothetical protein
VKLVGGGREEAAKQRWGGMGNFFFLGPNKAVNFTQYIRPGSHEGSGVSMAKHWPYVARENTFCCHTLEKVARNKSRTVGFNLFFVHLPPQM